MHVGSASDNENIRLVDKSFDYQVRVLRNRYYTIIKNVPKGVFISIFPYLVMAEIGMMLVYSIKYPKTFKALQKARKLVKEKMAILREKRRLVQQSIKVNNKYIKSFFIKI